MKKREVQLQMENHGTTYTLKEICEVCHVRNDIIIEMVQFDILHPQGKNPDAWQFSQDQLNRSRRALRIQHDLEINLPGTAMALDLLDEINELRNEVFRMKQLLKSLNLD